MKTVIFLFAFLIITCTVTAQPEYFIDFDSPYSKDSHIIIDTLSNPDNIWQIGKPDKPVFTNAFNSINAIVTDTMNPYPVNDTSVFIIEHYRAGSWGTGNYELTLKFWYQFDSDTLTDYGMIEVSFDSLQSWINLITDTIYNLWGSYPKPVLTGNSNGWQYFDLELGDLKYLGDIDDTIYYRFTFISDSIQTNKDGWMLDDFEFTDYWEGIAEYKNSDLIRVYPNPAKEYFALDYEVQGNYRELRIDIVDAIGKLVFSKRLIKQKYQELINLQGYKPGFYIINVIGDGKIVESKKLTITK